MLCHTSFNKQCLALTVAANKPYCLIDKLTPSSTVTVLGLEIAICLRDAKGRQQNWLLFVVAKNKSATATRHSLIIRRILGRTRGLSLDYSHVTATLNQMQVSKLDGSANVRLEWHPVNELDELGLYHI
jgi:hypothetical protein